MGRKPNPLILRYFERGAKLNDSSNRYQHTCKSCGEKFPKGRIDSLTTHLIKKCPAISLEHRREALLALNNMPSNADARHNGGVQMNGPTVDLPIGSGPRNWTALETLAEVSRQIGTGEKHDPTGASGASGTPEPNRADRLELQEQYTLENPPVSYEQRVQREKKPTNQKASHRENEASPAAFNYHPQMTGSPSNSQNLAMAATSLAAAAAARYIPSMVDPQLLADDQNLSEAKPLPHELHEADTVMSETFYNTSHEQQSPWHNFDVPSIYPEPEPIEHSNDTPTITRAPSYPRLAMVPMSTEFAMELGNGEKSIKQRVRGKFTSERRKEVQSVRKSGACIRCRMLRKTCSLGDPCDTCKAVDQPRLWKNACIRTKLADNFELYSCGLHVVLAHNGVKDLKSRANFHPASYQIEASHFPVPETSTYALFNALEAQQMSDEGNIDPGLSSDYGVVFRVIDDNDETAVKLEAYLKRMVSHYVEKEPSHFMKTSLRLAQNLALEKQDHVLSDVIELWATVHIFVASELRWTFSKRIDKDAPPGSGPKIDTDEPGSQLLDLQINAAAEKKASQLCKEVLSSLEKRLLRRDPETFFETFLISLIFLNCVEKSTWLFTYWQQENFKESWPLSKEQETFISQGEKTTNHLIMLLRYRNAPPKTRAREDGVLVVDPNAENEKVVNYFAELNLTYNQIQTAQAESSFDLADCRCFEMMYCSKLLLPAN